MIYPFLNLKHLDLKISPDDYKESEEGVIKDTIACDNHSDKKTNKTNTSSHKYTSQAMAEAAEL